MSIAIMDMCVNGTVTCVLLRVHKTIAVHFARSHSLSFKMTAYQNCEMRYYNFIHLPMLKITLNKMRNTHNYKNATQYINCFLYIKASEKITKNSEKKM